MENLQKLKANFATVLERNADSITNDLTYDTDETWDSMRHMKIVVEIEKTFDIMMDTDDIIDMSSFAKAKEILKKKYDIDFID